MDVQNRAKTYNFHVGRYPFAKCHLTLIKKKGKVGRLKFHMTSALAPTNNRSKVVSDMRQKISENKM